MKLYAEQSLWRLRQIAGDVAVAIWVGVWIRIGMWIDTLVNRLQGPGRFIEESGRRLADSLTVVAERIGDLPVIGDDVQHPFQSAAGAGRSLVYAAQAQQDVVHTLAVWLGSLLAIIPIGYVLYRYVPARWRWVREATAATKLRIDAADLELFAIRAVATRPLYELRRACPDPAAALAAREFTALAHLELGALGLAID